MKQIYKIREHPRVSEVGLHALIARAQAHSWLGTKILSCMV